MLTFAERRSGPLSYGGAFTGMDSNHRLQSQSLPSCRWTTRDDNIIGSRARARTSTLLGQSQACYPYTTREHPKAHQARLPLWSGSVWRITRPEVRTWADCLRVHHRCQWSNRAAAFLPWRPIQADAGHLRPASTWRGRLQCPLCSRSSPPLRGCVSAPTVRFELAALHAPGCPTAQEIRCFQPARSTAFAFHEIAVFEPPTSSLSGKRSTE